MLVNSIVRNQINIKAVVPRASDTMRSILCLSPLVSRPRITKEDSGCHVRKIQPFMTCPDGRKHDSGPTRLERVIVFAALLGNCVLGMPQCSEDNPCPL